MHQNFQIDQSENDARTWENIKERNQERIKKKGKLTNCLKDQNQIIAVQQLVNNATLAVIHQN